MTPLEKYESVIAGVADATPGKMFGALCIKAPNGKAVAMFYKDHMVFKLRDEAFDEAMALDGTGMFEPMPGRQMNGWVQVPFDYADRWSEFAEAAMAYVKTLEK